jgi:hypothetical protein
MRSTTLSLMGSIMLALPVAAYAATQDNFQLNTTGDLVALCSAESSDPMMTAAVNMCHGFFIATYRVLAVEETKERRKMFCVPSPAPNRNEAIAEFVSWARANPSRLAMPPSDAILGFLESSFPCKATTSK